MSLFLHRKNHKVHSPAKSQAPTWLPGTRVIQARIMCVLVALVFGCLGMSAAQGAASLMGEQVTLTVRYQVSPQGGGSIDQVLYTSSFTVGSGVEVSSQPVSFTYMSGGYPQTISGNISADVGANTMSVNFTGTQQPGGLLFVLSSVTDQSAGGISSATLTSSSGFQSGVNMTEPPTYDNSGNGSVTANLFLLGYQPGVNLSENISFGLVTSPTVTTLAPTSVTASSATLNGSINANGASVTASFDYGLTTSYGSSVAASPGTVTGSSATAIAATISGLIPGTTYHYRAVGTVSGGVGHGADQTFTVPATTTVSVLGTPVWSNSGSTLASVTVPAGTNRVLVVAASGENVNGDPAIDLTGVTFNGTSLVQGVKVSDASYLVDGLWYLALGTSSSATTANVVVTPSSVTTVSSIGAVSFQNVNQVSPLNSFQSATNFSGIDLSSSVTVAGSSSDLVMDLLDVYAASAIFPGTGQTVAFTGGDSTGSEFYVSSLKLGAASVPMSWTTTNGQETIQLAANIVHAAAVNVAPAITGDPTNLTVTAGGTATFTAAASGTPSPTVQWEVSTNGGTSFNAIPAATSTTLSFSTSTSDDGKQYRAVFTNTAGSATSTAATLTVIGPAAALVFSQEPGSAVAGSSISPAVKVQILDAAGHLTASTVAVSIAIGNNPGAGTLSGTASVNAVAGVATFSGLSIDKAGTGYTLTASSSGLPSTNSLSFNITAGAATKFSVSAPANTTAGTAFNFSVTALDQFNNTVTSYGGTVHFTSTDGAAVLPANTTLASGTGTFSGTLKTAGNRTITATDTVSSLITGASSAISVAPAAATHFAVSAPANATAGTAFSLSVTAMDQFNNTATGYGGTVHFAATDGNGTLPADTTLINGIGTFSTTLKTAGSQTISAVDTVSSSITGTSGSIAVAAAAATHFIVSAPANATAGTAFNFTVTAQDQFNNTATGYGGTVHFTSTDGAAVLPANATLANGAGTFSASLKTAGTQTVSATDTVSSSITGTSGSIVVAPAAATHFAVSAPANGTAGTAFSFTVTAMDPFNNTATGYGGTVHFTTTDGNGTLPADSTLSNGVGTFSATLKTAGSQTITATDAASSSITGTSGSIVVAPAAATHFTVSAPANGTAGTAFSLTVTALDQFNNTATGYGGTVHFTTTDGNGTLPADSTLSSGVGSFSVTLTTAGTQTITATDTASSSITGTSGSIVVAPSAATHFTVSAPANTTAGMAFSLTVTALDQFNNTATGYGGTVHFTSTDGMSLLPADSTLASGTGSFSATLKTAGSQTITATDTASSSITGTSGSIVVAPAAATHFAVSAPANATAGTAFSLTVTALDQFNNTATGYSGTVHFTATDGNGTLPADTTLSSGVGSFSATLTTAGTQTISATDTASSSITGTSGSIVVVPAAATHFTVSAPASTIAGTAFNITVTALDPYNNTATAYGGTVHFTSTDGMSVLPVDSTLTSGTGTFSATLKTAGAQTITATDTGSAPITGTSGNINVAPAAATHLAASAPANATAGTAFSLTVTALDQFNNTATGYTGTVHFTSTDGSGVLPADTTLTSGAGSFSATLKTAGTQTITATDTVTSSITGTSGNITVVPAAATHFVLDTPAVAKARISTNLTVTALDQFNNTATGYAGTVHFTSTDPLAALPADTTLTNGLGTYALTMGTAGIQTVTATDIAASSVTGSSGPIEVLDLQIVVPPANQFVLPGANATFSVGVSGTAPFAYQWFTNLTAISGATNSALTVSNATLLTATNYTVVITNAWGSVTSGVATLTLSGYFNYTNTLNVGRANLNTLTGLYEEQVNVTNLGGPFTGLRLLVGNLPAQVSLYHAAGTTNGMPYVDFAVNMASGQTGTFLLQFLDPFRLSFTNTVQTLALNAGPSGTTASTNTITGIPISKVLMDTSIPGSPRFTLAFASVVGQHYQVLYSDDQMQTWTLADTLTANATWTIWTEILPESTGSRLFKVILIP